MREGGIEIFKASADENNFPFPHCTGSHLWRTVLGAQQFWGKSEFKNLFPDSCVQTQAFLTAPGWQFQPGKKDRLRNTAATDPSSLNYLTS